MIGNFLQYNPNPKLLNIVVAGDSLTYNGVYLTALMKMLFYYKNARKTNLGYSGEASSAMLGRVNQAIAAHDSNRENILVYWIGTNDTMINPLVLETFANNCISYYTQTKNLFHVICLGLTDLLPDNRHYNGIVINEYLRNYWPLQCHEYIHLFDDTRLQNSNDTTYFNVDGIHLNALGSKLVANMVYKKISDYLNK